MKALYINTRNKTILTSDGAHLVIITPDNRIQKTPLGEINSLLVRGKVLIDSQAVFLLARNNISMVLAEENGYKDALFLPYNHFLPDHHRGQRIILKSSRNIEKYVYWVKTQRMLQQIIIINRFSPELKIKNELGEGNYQLWIKEKRPNNIKLWKLIKTSVNTLFKCLISGKLNEARLDIHMGGYFRRANFGLLLDILFIVEPRIDEQSLLFFQQKNWESFIKQEKIDHFILLADGFHNIVHRFENKKSQISDIIDLIIDDYFSLLRELKS